MTRNPPQQNPLSPAPTQSVTPQVTATPEMTTSDTSTATLPTPSSSPNQQNLAPMPDVSFAQPTRSPIDDLPFEEQRILHELAIERLHQLNNNGGEAYERQQTHGELLQGSVAYILEAQSAVTGSSPITAFRDIHPDPENAVVYGPRENLFIAMGLIMAQIKHSDQAALNQQAIHSTSPLNVNRD